MISVLAIFSTETVFFEFGIAPSYRGRTKFWPYILLVSNRRSNKTDNFFIIYYTLKFIPFIKITKNALFP
jgi:hypothetical protein